MRPRAAHASSIRQLTVFLWLQCVQGNRDAVTRVFTMFLRHNNNINTQLKSADLDAKIETGLEEVWKIGAGTLYIISRNYWALWRTRPPHTLSFNPAV